MFKFYLRLQTSGDCQQDGSHDLVILTIIAYCNFVFELQKYVIWLRQPAGMPCNSL